MPSSRDIIGGSVSTELIEKGIELPAARFPSLGWTRSDAIRVVDQLEASGVVISGGDVWQVEPSGRVRPAYANWHYDLDDRPIGDDDVRHAAAEARRYISDLNLPSDDTFLIEVVCHAKLTT